MTHEDAFLADIIEHPDDDSLRLIYADFLDERGDPRGEFIRTQIELARLPDNPGSSSRRLELEARERALLEEHEQQWLGRVGDWVCVWSFHRGFLASITIKLQPLLAISAKPGEDDWFGRGAAAVREMKILDAVADFDALCRSPHLARLTSLSLRENQLSDRHVQALAGSPHLGSLTRLDLGKNRIGWAGVKALAESVRLPRLTMLDLSENAIDDLDLLMMARCTGLPSLAVLDVSVNPVHFPDSVSTLLSRLEVVKVSGAGYSEEEREVLLTRFGDRVRFS